MSEPSFIQIYMYTRQQPTRPKTTIRGEVKLIFYDSIPLSWTDLFICCDNSVRTMKKGRGSGRLPISAVPLSGDSAIEPKTILYHMIGPFTRP